MLITFPRFQLELAQKRQKTLSRVEAARGRESKQSEISCFSKQPETPASLSSPHSCFAQAARIPAFYCSAWKLLRLGLLRLSPCLYRWAIPFGGPGLLDPVRGGKSRPVQKRRMRFTHAATLWCRYQQSRLATIKFLELLSWHPLVPPERWPSLSSVCFVSVAARVCLLSTIASYPPRTSHTLRLPPQ